MTLSTNNFNKDVPTKTTGAFAKDRPTASSISFAKDRPAESKQLPDGENTSAIAFSEEQESFGEIFGQDSFASQVHFVKRPAVPVITH